MGVQEEMCALSLHMALTCCLRRRKTALKPNVVMSRLGSIGHVTRSVDYYVVSILYLFSVKTLLIKASGSGQTQNQPPSKAQFVLQIKRIIINIDELYHQVQVCLGLHTCYVSHQSKHYSQRPKSKTLYDDSVMGSASPGS